MPVKRFSLASWLLAALLFLSPAKQAFSEEPPVVEDVDFNYVYSAVLGTGYYTAGSERVLVVRVPLSWTLTPLDEKNSIKLLFPITAGVRDIIDQDGDFDFPDQLLTASFLPGVAWERYMAPNWMLVPSFQIGGARDLQLDTTAWLSSLALRSFAWWDIGKHRLGLGNRILGATQYNTTTKNQTGFIQLENGVDWDYRLPWKLAGRDISSSIYVLWQHYSDSANFDVLTGESFSLKNLFQLGTTFGFREPVTLFGFIPIQRVGIGIGRGNTVSGHEFKSIFLNLGFPLSYN